MELRLLTRVEEDDNRASNYTCYEVRLHLMCGAGGFFSQICLGFSFYFSSFLLFGQGRCDY
jgi:hypothetical protein